MNYSEQLEAAVLQRAKRNRAAADLIGSKVKLNLPKKSAITRNIEGCD